MIYNNLIFFGFLIFAKCLTTIEAVNNVKNGLEKSTEVKQSNKTQSSPFASVATTVSSIITEKEASKENVGTSERTTEEIATTHIPEQRKFRPSSYYENGGNYEAALVILPTPKSVSEPFLSTTESVTPEPKNETTPRVLTPEEKIHPIIFDFISRIKRVKNLLSAINKTSTPMVHPVETFFNPRDPNNPKLKYFEDFYREVLNVSDTDNTNTTKDHRDSSFIRAYYAKKNFPTAIDYSKEDDSVITTLGGPENHETPKRSPFNTKGIYSPKYKQFSKFHYEFFPYYNGSKIIVPIHT
ncbi:uncharacterized protein LOC123259401 [Cotesia glomerata]|uniref:uncharacterized protein LOC123259401 n=1 Tax=Cotesia glomerata TaxID=32391 RepID=UPI001D01D6FF|nr:uncharacterized protein LOC123259401 [Cotesia glomerata]